MKEAIKENFMDIYTIYFSSINDYELVTEKFGHLGGYGALRFKTLINKKYICNFFIEFDIKDNEIKDGINYLITNITTESTEILLSERFNDKHGRFGTLNYSELNGFSFYLLLDHLNKGMIQSLHYDLTEDDLNELRNQQEIKKEEVKTEQKEANGILKHFNYSHLPESLQEVSKPICELAKEMNSKLPDCAEKQAGLRKLLEAKDCFVRANLENNNNESKR